jgi:copper(I)-binding protein
MWLLLVPMLLVGCGAGPDAATSRDAPAVPGVDADLDGIAIRNAQIVFHQEGYPAGGSAPAELVIVNQGQAPVRLQQLSSPGAASVTVIEPQGDQLELAPGQLVRVTMLLTGLAETQNGTGTVPVELGFDNGATATLNLPMAPPVDPLPPASPVVVPEEH